MAAKHIVVIGASAGGIETQRELVRDLPEDFPAPIAIVPHTAPQSPIVLHEILSRSGPLPAAAPRDRERLSPERIYVAPPDCHPPSDFSALVARTHELEGQAGRLRAMVTDASPVMHDESRDRRTSASVHDMQ